MAADAVWAYCVVRAGEAAGGGGPGVHEGDPVTWLREGDLALLASRVPLDEFGEAPLRRNLNDLAWLERVARAHEAAIDRALDAATVVPLRLCTIFADQDAARGMLAERGPELAAALDAVDGRVEWSVKLLVDRERLKAAVRDPEGDAANAPAPGSGAAYLVMRRDERRVREEMRRLAGRLAEEVHEQLRDFAGEARVRPAQNRELSGHEGDMVLNGAYLVERARAGELRRLVAELQERHAALGARLVLGGPFPPYNFVPEAR